MRWQDWRRRAEPLDVDGLAVATYDLGPDDGPAVTFLHGFPSSSLDIEPVFRRLPGCRLVTLDFPGFGASAKPRGHRYTLAACADAVERLWHGRGVTATVLVAHDYGVSVAQELLARRAERGSDTALAAVVWMNGGLYPELHRPTRGQQLMMDPDHGAEVAAGVTREMFVDGIRGTWGERIPFDVDAATEMWRSMDDGGGVPLMHDLLHYIDERRTHADRWAAALAGTDVDQVFVWGDLDPVSGAHMIDGVVARVPSVVTDRLGDVGHWPLLEAPDVVARVILERCGR